MQESTREKVEENIALSPLSQKKMTEAVTSGAGPRAVGTERGRWSNW